VGNTELAVFANDEGEQKGRFAIYLHGETRCRVPWAIFGCPLSTTQDVILPVVPRY
jgi:hypothetical protein